MNFTPTQQRIGATVILLFVVFVLIQHLQPILMPFVMALGLSYLLSPWVDRLELLFGHKSARMVSVVLVQLVFLALVL